MQRIRFPVRYFKKKFEFKVTCLNKKLVLIYLTTLRINFKIAEENVPGHRLKNNSWNGVIGDLQRNVRSKLIYLTLKNKILYHILS